MEIKGIKKAVGDYKRANGEGWSSPRYGFLMLDRNNGEVWTDEFYSLGHNEWKEYHDASVINLVDWARDHGHEEEVSMKTVKEWAIMALAK